MARYTGPVTRKSRRLGVDLVGGDQSFEKRPYPPGQHGRARIKESEYRQQLQEKQKARFSYGVMEKQFRRYFAQAQRQRGVTGILLIQLLEMRLDIMYFSFISSYHLEIYDSIVPASVVAHPGPYNQLLGDTGLIPNGMGRTFFVFIENVIPPRMCPRSVHLSDSAIRAKMNDGDRVFGCPLHVLDP